MPSKREELGLKKYLNATEGLHDGFGFNEFQYMMDRGAKVASIARHFKVARKTVYEWIKMLESDQ